MGRPKKKADGDATEFETLGIKTSKAWADYARRGAKHCRTDFAKMADIAIVKYLQAQGFDEEPPERIP